MKKVYQGTSSIGQYEGDPEARAAEIVAEIERAEDAWEKEPISETVYGRYPRGGKFEFEWGQDELMADVARILIASGSAGLYMSAYGTKTEDSPYLVIYYPRPVGRRDP